MAGAVAPLILMFKKEILKRATSKHAKKMKSAPDTLQNKIQMQKQIDRQVEETKQIIRGVGTTSKTPK